MRIARLPPPKNPPGPGLNRPAGAPPPAAAAAVGVAMPEWGDALPLKAWLLLRGRPPKSCGEGGGRRQ